MPENDALFRRGVGVWLFALVISLPLLSGAGAAVPEKDNLSSRSKLYAGGDLNIESVHCPLDTLYPGQQDVPVEITVANFSDTTVLVQMLQLYFSESIEGDRNADYEVSGELYPNQTVSSGEQSTYNLLVEVDQGALQDTLIYVDAYVVGRRMDNFEEITVSTTTGLFLDRFMEISYSGDDGTSSWSGDWEEIDESDGPESGDVRVVDDFEAYGNILRIGRYEEFRDGCGIRRALDLDEAVSATLSFDWQRSPSRGFYGSDLLVQVSGNGGSSWNTVYTIDGGGEDTRINSQVDISPYISSDTGIRFVTNNEGDGYMYLDNIRVDYSRGLGADSWVVLSQYLTAITALYHTSNTAVRSDDSLMCICAGEPFQLNSVHYLNDAVPLAGIPLDAVSNYRLVVQINPAFDWVYDPNQSERGYFALYDAGAGWGSVSSLQPGTRELLLTDTMVVDEETEPDDFVAGVTERSSPPVPWSMDTDPFTDPLVASGKVGEYASVKYSDSLSRDIIDCVDGGSSWDLTPHMEKERYYFYEMWFKPDLEWSHGDMADLYLHLQGSQPDQKIDQLHLRFRMADDDTVGPVFSDFQPGIIPEGTDVSISCRISDPSGVYDDDTGSDGNGVYILWDTDGSIIDDANEIQMYHSGSGIFETESTLGSFGEGEELTYRVFACDNDNDTGSSDRTCSSSELQNIQIVGIVYLSDEPSSLNPQSVYRGQNNVTFNISLNNSMPDGIWLYTPSYISFHDGVDTVTANLANPTWMEAGTAAFPIGFEAANIPEGFSAPDTLDVTLHLEGWYEGTASAWNQTWKASSSNRIIIKQPRVVFDSHSIPSPSANPGDHRIELLRMELVSEALEDISLDSLTVTNLTTGLGEVPENDQNISRLYLYRQVGERVDGSEEMVDGPENRGMDGPGENPGRSIHSDSLLKSRPFRQSDSLAAAGNLADGEVRFKLSAGRHIPAGNSVYYYVVADIDSFHACDGDSLDICIPGPDSVFLNGNASVAFQETPLNSEGKVAVDGSMSFQTGLGGGLPDTLYSGESDCPVLAVDIRCNGYKADILKSLNVKDSGDDGVVDVIDRLRLWRDNGDSIFASGNDECLGELSHTGNLYQITGLTSPVTIHRRYFVTADFNNDFSGNLSVLFGIPVGGIGMNSDNDGPIDREIIPDSSQVLIRREVVTLEEYPHGSEPEQVHPGDRNVELYSFRLENNTLESLTLDSLTVWCDSALFHCSTRHSMELFADDGNGEFDPLSDLGLKSTTGSDGRAVFGQIGFNVPSGSEEILFVSSHLDSFITPDGDTLSLSIRSEDDVVLEFASEADFEIEADFPLERDACFTDGMMAHQIILFSLPDSTISGGAENFPFIDMLLPGNGCMNDTLEGLRMLNNGTAGDNHLEKIKIWKDDGDGVFDATRDDSLSCFAISGQDTVKFSGLSVPIDGGSGTRIFATVDLREGYKTGATLKPAVPRMGVEVSSGNDGPLDQDVVSENEIVIPPPDRITLYTSLIGDKRVYPGDEHVLNMVVGAYNSYSEPKVLKSLELYEGGSIKPGEVEEVSAFSDADGDGLFNPQVDSFLVSVTSGNSLYSLEDLDLSLNPYRSNLLFITFSTVTRGIRDSVSVDLSISDAASIEFDQEGVKLEGEFPLNSAGSHLTDGMIAVQLDRLAVNDSRVTPGDTDIPCFSLRIPCNGTIPDSLLKVSMNNAGTCTPGVDISSVKLWKEAGGDDEIFNPGEEEFLGYLFWNGSRWATMSDGVLSPLDCQGLVIHLTVDIAESAIDSRTVEMYLPVGGIQVDSGNDGPLDNSVNSASVIEVTTDPLMVDFQVPSSVTRGQEFEIHMQANNVSDTLISGVYPDSFDFSGSGSVTLRAGPDPPSGDIDSGGEGIFIWTLQADSLGKVAFGGMAAESDGEAESKKEYSDSVAIEDIPDGFFLTLGDLSPVSLNRGREDVSLVEMIMSYGTGCDRCAGVELDSLKFSFIDQDEQPVEIGDVADLVRIRDEARVIQSLNTSGWDDSVIVFSGMDTVLFHSGDSRTVKLAMNISDSASVSAFKIRIQADGWVVLSDENSGRRVDFEGTTFPWSTNAVTVKSPATQLVIGMEGGFPSHINKGQENVEAFTLGISNQGNSDGADISLSEIVLRVRDQYGDTISCSDLLRRFRVEDETGFNVYSTEIPGPTASIHCRFDQELIVSPQMPLSLRAIIDCLDDPERDGIAVTLDDSATVSARDINSGKTVPVREDTSNGISFPLTSGVAMFRDPLSGMEAGGDGLFPSRLIPGSSNVEFIRLVLRHPGEAGESAAILKGLTINTLDQEGERIDPSGLLEGIRVVHGSDSLVTEYITGQTTSVIELVFSDSLKMEPGSRDTLIAAVDFSPSAPSGYVQMHLYGDGMDVADATDGTRLALLEGEFPISSGVTRIIPPPDRVVFSGEGIVPPNIAGGEVAEIMDLHFSLDESGNGEEAELEELVLEVLDERDQPVNAGNLIEQIVVLENGEEVNALVSCSDEDVIIQFSDSLPISMDRPVDIRINAEIKENSGIDIFSIQINSPSDISCRDITGGEAVSVEPGSGLSFPFSCGRVAILGRDMKSAFSNYPNPFVPSRENTRITYYLPGEGMVTLKIFTMDGRCVATLLDNQPRSRGLHQDVVWDGRNGRGEKVINGVYFLVIRERIDNREYQFKRKISLVR